MTGSRRELVAAVAGCVVAGGLALTAGGQTWATATVIRRPPLPPATELLTGARLFPLVSACGLLVLAAAVAVLAVRGRSRLLVGLLAAVAGGTLLWSGSRPAVAGIGAADLSDGVTADATTIDVVVHGVWPALTAVAGLLALAAGGLTLLRGRSWTGMGRRYERPTAPGAAPGNRAPRTDQDHALDAWRALDRGEDPTVDPTVDPVVDPVVDPAPEPAPDPADGRPPRG